MANIVKFMALGGLDENGKNLYCIEVNGDIIVFDAGMKFPEQTNIGIDMIIPDLSYLKDHKVRVKGYFISHGHDDIMASLPYLVSDVPAPIYCSAPTAYMINITTKRLQMKVDYDFVIVKSGDTVSIGGHDATFFATTHSARESLGIALDTPDGAIVYTSDYLFDYEALSQYRTDYNLLSKLGDKKVLMLLNESVACDKSGHTSPKHKLTKIIEPYFSEKKGRVFLSFYYQNVFAIREVIDLAVKWNRKIFVYGDILRDVMKYSIDENLNRILSKISVKENELRNIGNENVIVLIGGQGEEVFTDLSRMAHGEDKNFAIKPYDTVIIASPAVSGLEVYATKVVDELFKTGAKVFNIKEKSVVAMHARAEDIKMMISILKPKFYIPVKGDYKNLVLNAEIAKSMNLGYNDNNVFVFDNGMLARFQDGNYVGIEDFIDLKDQMIDGFDVGNFESQVLDDRNKLGEEGVLILGISVDSATKTILAGPDVQMRGLIFLKDADELLMQLVTTFDAAVQESLNNGTINQENTRIKINEKLTHLVRKFTGKSPLILPVIMDNTKK